MPSALFERLERKGSGLTLQNVGMLFGSQRVLGPIDLTIEPGEFVALMGPSGSGKTSLLRIIAGLVDDFEGRLFAGGQDITDVPVDQRQSCLIWQSYALFPHLNVRRNIEFPLKVRRAERGLIDRRVSEAAHLVRVSGLLDRGINQLSGGEKQRVAIARALVADPEILLLDEPLSALDPQLRGTMQMELKRLQRKLGITFIYVTHSQSEALSLADRVVVLNKGRVEQVDSVAALLGSPKNRFVAQFVGSNNVLRGTVMEISDRGVRVAAREGSILAGKWSPAVALGDQVDVIIPFSAVALDECSALEAQFVGFEYTGTDRLCVFESPSGTELRGGAMPAERAPPIGAHVRLAIAADRCCVVPS